MSLSDIITSVINAIKYVQDLEPRMRRVIRGEIRNARRTMFQTALQIFLFSLGGLLLLAGLIIYLTRYVAIDFTLLLFGIVLVVLGLLAAPKMKKHI